MKRGRILILLGIILGLITTVAAFMILQGAQQQPAPKPTEIPTQKVLVAIQNISQAQPIDPAIVQLREFEKTQVPPDAVFSIADVAGKLAAVDIAQGQIIRRDMLTDKVAIVERGIHASFLIPPGKVAVAFPITELSSVAYALQPGDTVDVLVTIKLVSVDPKLQIKEPVVWTAPANAPASNESQPTGSQIPRMVTQLTLQDVTVLKVGPWNTGPKPSATPAGPTGTPTPAAPPPPGSPPQNTQATPEPIGPTIITVLVDQQDALVLKFARESEALIDFALRGRNDHEIVTTEPVTLEYMIRRFNITPPENLPYAIEMEGAPAPSSASSGSAPANQ